MEKLIKKYIDRIKIDYPEDDKLMMDLQDFYREAQSQALPQADIIKSVCLQCDGAMENEYYPFCCKTCKNKWDRQTVL